MYAYIKGSYEYSREDYVVVENGGIGYKIHMSQYERAQMPAKGEEVTVHIYTHIREDIFDLYGFLQQDSLDMFELLIGVSGVGPKVALGILSALTPSTFLLAVSQGDHKAIAKAPGVGAKMSQRIVLELKDKVKGFHVEDFAPTPLSAAEENSQSEAVSALVVLGYTPMEAKKAVAASGADTTEEIIRDALKLLMK